MLRATTPCTFSTSQLPKVLRNRQFLTLFTSKCASRHNAVHFFDISTSKSAPRPTVLTLFTSLCVYLCIFSSVKFSLHLSFDLPLDLSINLSSRHVDNKTMLLDFCWQHQKRSNSARLSHFLQLKTSKTKQFCEASFKNGRLTVQLTASYQCVLRFFHAMSLKYCACQEKVSPGQRNAAPVTKKHLGIAADLIRLNAAPLRKSAP